MLAAVVIMRAFSEFAAISPIVSVISTAFDDTWERLAEACSIAVATVSKLVAICPADPETERVFRETSSDPIDTLAESAVRPVEVEVRTPTLSAISLTILRSPSDMACIATVISPTSSLDIFVENS